jgi:DNA-binding NarL/FixJ family response regulator
MKAEATENVVTAIRRVLSGQIYVSDKMAAKMVRKLVGGKRETGASAIERLSDRELEVFSLIGQGQGTRQIAEKLHLSVKTVETYRAHIKEKLNLADANELLQYAIQWVRSQDA